MRNREPGMLAAWERSGLYGKIRAAAKGRPSFVLTDGPPYANGAIHLGHAREQDPQGHHRQVAHLGRL